jgi:glutamine cyclotransferase
VEGGGTPAGTAPGSGPSSAADVRRQRVEVVEARPHDPAAFTQGLEQVDGRLYESTGLYGQSSLREVDPVSGAVLRQVALEPGLFGEGLTAVGDVLVQLTWREGVALRWDRDTFAPLDRLAFDREGWGVCYDAAGEVLVTSDGTDTLAFRGRDDLVTRSTVPVTADGVPVTHLNELECDAESGLVWANVWLTDEIVGIDPATGEVRRRVDASSMRPEGLGADAVLNGIAALGDGTFLLTGKLWPQSFVVRFVDAR